MSKELTVAAFLKANVSEKNAVTVDGIDEAYDAALEEAGSNRDEVARVVKARGIFDESYHSVVDRAVMDHARNNPDVGVMEHTAQTPDVDFGFSFRRPEGDDFTKEQLRSGMRTRIHVRTTTTHDELHTELADEWDLK